MTLNLKKESLVNALPTLNVCLAVSAALLIVYFFLSLGQPNYFMPLEQLRSRQMHTTDAVARLPEMPAFSDDIFHKKPLFPLSSESARPSSVPRHEFTLLGVSLGEKSLAMIRDSKTSQDYYCAIGDSIGSYKVVHITKHKVILDSGTEIIEINQ